jgi:peptidyl-prolyl cis-trans isomerase C
VEARIAQVRERLGGEEALAAALVGAGMSAEQLRSGAEHGLVRERLRDAKFAHLEVSSAAVARFYRANRKELFTEPAAVRLSSIVLRTEHLAKDVLLKIERGEGFAALARMYSRDPESKESGGMLGWIITDTLPEPLARAVRGVHAGLVRAPVEGPVGWYILKVHERRPETATPLAEVADEVRAELNLRRRVRAFDRWVERAVGRADVERLSE